MLQALLLVLLLLGPCCRVVAAAHHFSLAGSLPRPHGSNPWSPGREPSRWAGKAVPGNQLGRLLWAACRNSMEAGQLGDGYCICR